MLTWVEEMRNHCTYDINVIPAQLPRPAGDPLVDSRMTAANVAKIPQLNDLVQFLAKKLLQIELALEGNEKKAMDIPLDYLDADGDGEIKPEDCPELSSLLFPSLEGRKGSITRESVRARVQRLGEGIESVYLLSANK